jgi:hypothetical protein
MDLYSYHGPVTMFDRCVANSWEAETYAISEKKAKSNLIFQYKKQNGLQPTSKVSLPGKIVKLEQ